MKYSFKQVAALALAFGIATVQAASISEIVSNMKSDAEGSVYLGADGVLRTLGADQSTVLDYARLSPDQLSSITSGDTLAALAGVDGRDVTAETALFSVPADIAARAPDVTAVKRSPLERSEVEKRDRCGNYSCNSTYQCQVVSCSTCVVFFTPGSRNQCYA